MNNNEIITHANLMIRIANRYTYRAFSQNGKKSSRTTHPSNRGGITDQTIFEALRKREEQLQNNKVFFWK